MAELNNLRLKIIKQYNFNETTNIEIPIQEEHPLGVSVNGDYWLTLMCSPQELQEFCLGFLYTQGIIEGLKDIASIELCNSGDHMDVWLTRSVKKPEYWVRTTGCVGGISPNHPELSMEKIPINLIITPQMIHNLIEMMYKNQDLYRISGGIHTSVLSDGNQIILSSEDIGRHNTLDKIAGKCLMKNISSKDKIILTTGRISSDMLQKAYQMGISIIISRTSPTYRSVINAEQVGITIIGYARKNRFSIYSIPERVNSNIHNNQV